MGSDRGRLTRRIRKLAVSVFISHNLSPSDSGLVNLQFWMIFKSVGEDDAA